MELAISPSDNLPRTIISGVSKVGIRGFQKVANLSGWCIIIIDRGRSWKGGFRATKKNPGYATDYMADVPKKKNSLSKPWTYLGGAGVLSCSCRLNYLYSSAPGVTLPRNC